MERKWWCKRKNSKNVVEDRYIEIRDGKVFLVTQIDRWSGKRVKRMIMREEFDQVWKAIEGR